MKIIQITDNEYPKRLLEIKNPPEKLYVKGNIDLLNNNSIAIVGSRKCTDYGIKYTKKFAKEIANNNVTIVSGLAIGIDSVAHEIATKCVGNTIAVLGCGLNNIYPKENMELFNLILENNGCVISEYEPNVKVCMKNFPKRNRIISGISLGVLVTEAKFRSGTTITAKYGFEQNRKVFCLPRDIGETNGVGSNNLIKLGAKLVTDSKEILDELEIKSPKDKNIENDIKVVEDIDLKKELEKTEKYEEDEQSQIDEELKEIYNLISYVPKNINYIAMKSKCGISNVNQKLIILELKGYIKSLPGNNYVRC